MVPSLSFIHYYLNEYFKYLFSWKAAPIFPSNLILQDIVKHLTSKRINNIVCTPGAIKGEAGEEEWIPPDIQCYDSVNVGNRGFQD